jgi:hypothetical protein
MAAASGRRATASEQEIRNIDTRAAAHSIEARDPVNSDVRDLSRLQCVNHIRHTGVLTSRYHRVSLSTAALAILPGPMTLSETRFQPSR